MTPAPIRLICLSHLAWEERLFQRPQQLMTRFARRGCPVVYMARISSRRWMGMDKEEQLIRFADAAIAVNLPFVPLSGRLGFANSLSKKLVASDARARLSVLPGADLPTVLWIQHPDYESLATSIPHNLLVYDCMDPHDAFAATRPGLLAAERRLLERADLVFTGGRSLQKRCLAHRAEAICYPSGIDFDHFARAAEPGEPPEELARLEGDGPWLGYIGAIDERIDWQLVRSLCEARPEWRIAFVGPLLGMDRCPVKAPNFYHFGAKPYAELPDMLRGMRVALLPWKLNDLTRAMSPTKTPEYLAAGRPVVSVPVPDVVADYGAHVFIADGADAFIKACDRAVKRGPGKPRKPPAARTWDEIADAMMADVRKAMEGKDDQ